MSTLLAVAVFLVVVSCLTRAVGATGSPHHRDLDAWHVLMGSVMLVMLVGPLPRPLALTTLVLAAVALVWSTVRLLHRSSPGPQLRLALGWVAMAVMVAPLAVAAPATATSPTHAHGTATGGPGAWSAPTAVVVALLVALGVVLALRVAALLRPATAARGRWDACCDVVMVGAAAYMLLLAA